MILTQWTKIPFEGHIRKMVRAIEMNVCPLERRNMLPHILRYSNTLSSEFCLSLFKVARIPDSDGIDD